jgi:hypothetical protein
VLVPLTVKTLLSVVHFTNPNYGLSHSTIYPRFLGEFSENSMFRLHVEFNELVRFNPKTYVEGSPEVIGSKFQ